MKLVALWLTALGFALVAGSCSVSHRSDGFACDPTTHCSEGRTCVDGFCVFAADSGVPDGPHADAAVCPSQCTSCLLDQKSCTIDCGLNGGCTSAVTCPAGWTCNVLCSKQNACNSGVSCANSSSCMITCSGRTSCQNVTCGIGACNVACTGSGACSGNVSCGLAACNVNCSGTNSCGAVTCGSSCACGVTCGVNSSCNNVTCKPGCTSTSPFGGCSSMANGCNTCKLTAADGSQ